MRKPDTIMIEGRAYSCNAAQPQHSVLFAMGNDSRPEAERSADGRYREPTLLMFLQDART